MLNRFTAAAIAVACLVVSAPLAAFAQAAAAPAIDVGGVWNVLKPFIAGPAVAAVSVAGGWLVAKLAKLAHVSIEANYRSALHDAAVTGVDLALGKIGTWVGAMHPDVKSQLIADAVAWMIRSVPQAIAYLGVSPDKLEAIVESKLGILVGLAPAVVAPADVAKADVAKAA